MIRITINGEPREFEGGRMTLPEVVAALKLEPRTLLIEHNGEALTRTEWEGRPVVEGDRLEILRIAAGG